MIRTIKIHGKRVQIASARRDLNDWDMDDLLDWMAAADPNGEWRDYVNDFECAEWRHGKLTLKEMRDVTWETMSETNWERLE